MQPLYKSSFVVLLASLTAAATASDYTVEGGLSWWDLDSDNAWGSDITVYFSPVTTSTDRPLAEAGFLSRAGNLSINYARPFFFSDHHPTRRQGAPAFPIARAMRFLLPFSTLLLDFQVRSHHCKQ